MTMWKAIKEYWIDAIAVIAICIGVYKSCETTNSRVVQIANQPVKEVVSRFKRETTIYPSGGAFNKASNDCNGSECNSTIVSTENTRGASQVDHVRRADSINTDALRTPIDSTRRYNLWNGDYSFTNYGLCFAPGISLQSDGQNEGLGVDVRWLYAWDFSTTVGAAFYKHEKAKAQIALTYNLRRTKIFSNTDLIVGMSHDKSIFGGVRVELGHYWR